MCHIEDICAGTNRQNLSSSEERAGTDKDFLGRGYYLREEGYGLQIAGL